MEQFSVIVKTRAKKSGVRFDPETKTYHVSVKAPPENNKANLELLKLMKKELGKEVRLVSGQTFKKKVLETCK